MVLYNFMLYSPSSDEFPIEFIADEETGMVLYRELSTKYVVDRLCIRNAYTGKMIDTGIEQDAVLNMQVFTTTMDFVRSAPAEIEDEE